MVEQLIGQYVSVHHNNGYISGRLQYDDGYKVISSDGVCYFDLDQVSYVHDNDIFLKR